MLKLKKELRFDNRSDFMGNVQDQDGRVDILVVDDRPDKVLAMESILTDLNQNIVKATSGQEALRLLLQKDFAVILLDVNMPYMDGFETAKMIRQRRNSETTPIIFVSAIDGSEGHISRGYSLGAVDYIYLPIIPEVLKTKVSVFVELFKKTEQVRRLNLDLKVHAEKLQLTNQALEIELIERKRMEEVLKRAHDDLEIRVKERTSELTQANEELKRLNQIKSEFTSMVTHELRTPLGAIKEGINLVMDGIDGPVTEEQKETLEISRVNVDRLDRLIQNVLDFTRMESGLVSMFFEKADAVTLMQEVFALMQAVSRKKGVVLELNVPDGPVEAIYDADKLKQLVINLTHNAIKFTPVGGFIRLTVEKKEKTFILAVQDSGIGIKKEDHEKIFEMFAQVYPNGVYQSGGAGVGLAVCKLIVEQHRGTIEIESTPGKGSRFAVSLPLTQPV